MPTPLLVLTGPTAVGKSVLALELADHLQAEIVSADSRTVYIGMDIATAKPSLADRQRVPHHLIDIIKPNQEFSLADFLELAQVAINDIAGRGRLPMLVGGTVQYINALVEGWRVPRVAARPELRERLEQEAAQRGSQALYDDLKTLDPAAAEHINPLNVRRIVRALEVYELTGQLFSASQGKSDVPPYRTLKLALTLDRDQLYARADQRVEAMFEQGLIEEVRTLLANGYAPALPAMSSVGYAQVIGYLNGQFSLDEAKARLKFTTHRYIRQQYSWLRRDPDLHWLDAARPDLLEHARQLILEVG